MKTLPRKQLTIARSDGKRWTMHVTDDEALRLVAIVRDVNAGKTLSQDETALLLGYRRSMLQYHEYAALQKLRARLSNELPEEDAQDIVAVMFRAGEQTQLFDRCED